MKIKRRLTSPLILGILCAVGVNTVLFTDNGHRLQTAIVESDTTSHAEAHLVASDTALEFKVNITATNVTKIEGFMSYDDESVILSNPVFLKGTLDIADDGATKKITLNFSRPTTITKGDTLATWTLTPILPEVHSINLTNVGISMTDGGNRLLSTEGTGEF